jgi:GTP-binding protein HflX
MEHQIASVEGVLTQIGCAHIPTVMVYNKADTCYSRTLVGSHRKRYTMAAVTSAKTGDGLEHLRDMIATQALKRTRTARVRFPASDGQLAAHIRAHAAINAEDYEGDTAILDITAHDGLITALRGRATVESAKR